MRMRKKILFIENGSLRRTTFNKRKQGMMKKLTELVTLCDVKACAVVCNPDNPNPEVWPSREGVGEVVSEFLEVSMEERTKKMVDHEAFLLQRIAKEKTQLKKLCNENRDFKTRETMWDCLKGEKKVHQLGESDLPDLSSFIDKYLNKLTCRIKTLKENGKSSSLISPSIVGLIDFYGQIPQKLRDFNMDVNMSLNQCQNMILDLNCDLNLNIGEDDVHSKDGKN